MATKETTTQIKAVALRLFNDFGTAAISSNRIAEECEISKGNLHYHFKTKQEIIRALFADVVGEVEGGWSHDAESPTIRHLAAMFARQVLLIFRYRFLFRELAALLRDDEILLKRYQDFKARRTRVLVNFLAEIEKAGELDFGGSLDVIRRVVETRWIVSENWLNSQEFLGRKLSEDSISNGYELILGLMSPYFVKPETDVINWSRDAIKAYLADKL